MIIMQSIDEQDKDALASLSRAILTVAPMPLPLLNTFITVAKRGRITVADLAREAGLTQSATSRQLQDLSIRNRDGGAGLNLIEQRIEGIFTLNSLTPKGHELARKMAGELRRGQVRVAA
jgi:DNA-binding MarR family transcriptional regulator